MVPKHDMYIVHFSYRGKHQNISPICVFEGCVITWRKNIYESKILQKKSESLQNEGRHFRSMICKINEF